jgi:hypothetical protein
LEHPVPQQTVAQEAGERTAAWAPPAVVAGRPVASTVSWMGAVAEPQVSPPVAVAVAAGLAVALPG